jgi:ATP-dependent Lhr-like helicase
MLYDTLSKLETLGVCRRGYFIEGMGGAQFALPGAVERLRAGRPSADRPGPAASSKEGERALVIAAADPAQPYGAALPWPKREGQDRRPARVAGAYVVMVADEPALYVERGGRGLLSLVDLSAGAGAGADGGGGAGAARRTGSAARLGGGPGAWQEGDVLAEALQALAGAVRAGRVGKLALERIDGKPAIVSELAGMLLELGFHSGPRRLTLSA